MNGKRRKKRYVYKRMGYFRRLLLLICFSVMIFSGYNVISSKVEDIRGNNAYDDVANEFLNTPSATPTETAVSEATPTPSEVENDDVPPAESDEPKTSYVEDYAPDAWPDVDFDGLLKKNADTEAWLIGVGTNINYPVVHSHDNSDYLTHMFDGRASKLGAIFIDARNRANFVDRNTIIYGHNMRNHSMFWTLTQYKSRYFYADHPTMRLIRPEGRYEIQIFAGTVANADESEVWQFQFSDDEEFAVWVQMLRDRSSFKSDVTLGAGDRVVSLSTCSYEFTGARYVVFGKLVPLDGQTMPAIPTLTPQVGVNPLVPLNPKPSKPSSKPSSNGGGNNPLPDDAGDPETPIGENIVSDALKNAFDRIKKRGS
ncbi:MAG: class B sortase [Oscillospiraceae bacterium]|jgi:sortase B|nr:class B sortase [Oscillospiraceae bacterium]